MELLCPMCPVSHINRGLEPRSILHNYASSPSDAAKHLGLQPPRPMRRGIGGSGGGSSSNGGDGCAVAKTKQLEQRQGEQRQRQHGGSGRRQRAPPLARAWLPEAVARRLRSLRRIFTSAHRCTSPPARDEYARRDDIGAYRQRSVMATRAFGGHQPISGRKTPVDHPT